jgi:hypothetical protein
MIGSGESLDLAALVVPQAGGLEATGVPFEPYRLLDPSGEVVGPVAAYLKDLQACGRPETTQRSYGLALLRWFRFVWAVGVPWDQATRPVAAGRGQAVPPALAPLSRPGDAAPAGARGPAGAQPGDRQDAARQWLRAGHGGALRDGGARLL